jgi:translation initiation factor IF-3
MGSREALEIARTRELDLIEVAPTANPPVCRIMDYGRYKYEQAKREREAQKKSKAVEVKGVRLRPRIDEHDYQVRVRDAIKFLKEGDKVKATVIFKSREINHPEIARRLLEKMIVDTSEIAVVEKPPALEARTMTLILSPRPTAERPKDAAPKEAPPRMEKPAPQDLEKPAPQEVS